jgi:hypothetical protein
MILAGTAILMGTLLTGCGAESGPTAVNGPGPMADVTGPKTVDHSVFTDQIEETVVNPCNGETIQFTGTAVGQSNIVSVPGGPLHREIHAVISETGIGLRTGVSYTLHGTYHEVQQSPTGTALSFTFGLQDRGHVKSATPRLSFTWLYAIHFVGLPSGEVKVTKDIGIDDHYITECRG